MARREDLGPSRVVTSFGVIFGDGLVKAKNFCVVREAAPGREDDVIHTVPGADVEARHGALVTGGAGTLGSGGRLGGRSEVTDLAVGAGSVLGTALPATTIS